MKIVMISLLAIGVLVGALLVWLITTSKPPAPTGPYSITQLDLTELWHRDSTPTNQTSPELQQIALWLPQPPPDQSVPLVVYFTSHQLHNQSAIFELVSQGFAVLSLLDGKPQPFNFGSDAEYQQTLSQAQQSLVRRSRDASQLLDWLASKPDTLPVSIGTDAVGSFGYSFSGAVAAEFCWHDPRVKAVVNLDGWLFGQALEKGVPCEFVFFSDDSVTPTQAMVDEKIAAKDYSALHTQTVFNSLESHLPKHGGYLIQLKGSGHSSFSDTQLTRWLTRIGWPGRTSGHRATEVIQHAVSDFFSSALKADHKGQGLNLPYPVLEIKHWPPAPHLTKAKEAGETNTLADAD